MKVFRNIKPEFVDARGAITKLLDDGKTKIQSTLLITSKAGSVRSNHYHQKDAHYIYMLSGEMEYLEKKVGKGGKLQRAVIKKGDIVYTPPMAIHTSKFTKDSVFIALSIRSRHRAAYEKDTVRVESL